MKNLMCKLGYHKPGMVKDYVLWSSRCERCGFHTDVGKHEFTYYFIVLLKKLDL